MQKDAGRKTVAFVLLLHYVFLIYAVVGGTIHIRSPRDIIQEKAQQSRHRWCICKHITK